MTTGVTRPRTGRGHTAPVIDPTGDLAAQAVKAGEAVIYHRRQLAQWLAVRNRLALALIAAGHQPTSVANLLGADRRQIYRARRKHHQADQRRRR